METDRQKTINPEPRPPTPGSQPPAAECRRKSVAFATLGCKVNQYESSSLAEMFRARGYRVVDFKEKADVYVINTCTVTNLGDRKSRQFIRRATRTNPDGLVVVTGCYSQVSPGEVLEIPGVDLVTGTGDRARIVDLVEKLEKGRKINAVRESGQFTEYQELPAVASTGRVRAFLKIQEGCDNFCSYCIIPYARGPLRSRDTGMILEEARQLAAAGYREIVLTGIHTGAYGKDKGGGTVLAALLGKLAEIRGLARIRLSSVEPMDITGELISMLARGSPFCPHLHIPLQSGDDAILAAMRRGYRADDFRKLVAEVREKISDVSVTTDVIVGFPGEGDDHFANTYNLIRELEFSALHVFKFSPRKGTPAAGFPGRVPPEVKEERSNRLIALGKELSARFASRYLGRDVEVLTEECVDGKPGMMRGFTANYLPVAFRGEPGLRGEFAVVRTEKLSGGMLTGRIIKVK
ncbi:MAG: tRNA (N(6)-L-threonylcarbamoyladenosine(37)-C(2))-methylthiotransferase MtaB [Peptococcaceae bacterium]|nr:tRNA (N(6)-L-threonylcarbamoyladenosine(37)-C(2))-methylthiotransferase MtaB [Peptococcaceae bacterium]